MCHGERLKMAQFRACAPCDLRITVDIVLRCRPSPGRYNDDQGGHAPRHRGAAMTDLLDCVSLSLLPPWCWRVAADWLRRGDPLASVSARLLAARARDDADARGDIRALAA